MNLFHAIERQADARPDADALVWWESGVRRTRSFAALAARAAAIGVSLRDRAGVGPGDRVLVLVPPGPDLYAVLLALFRIGAPAVFIDPGAGLDQLGRACLRARPAAVIAAARAVPLFLACPALRGIDTRITLGFRFPGAVALDPDRTPPPRGAGCEDVSPDHPALLTFTSGSGGQPKGIVRSQGFLQAQGESLRSHLKLVPGEIDALSLPVFGLANLAAGVTSVLALDGRARPDRVDPVRFAARLREAGVERMASSPALAARLAAACDGTGRGPQLRKVYVGGGPIFPRLLRAFRAGFPHAHTTLVYGSSEAEPIALLDAAGVDDAEIGRVESGEGLPAGLPVGEMRVRIVPARADGAGEIQVSGPAVIQGYVDGVGDAETKLREDGVVWHRTGDAGRWGPGGTLRLLGRIAGAAGGRYPFEMEAVALRDASVRSAALLSLHGSPVLVIVGAAGRSVRQLIAEGSVVRVITQRSIPLDRRHRSKVDYRALRGQVERKSET